MTTPRSDAFVFFGATGDLAYKKIFPALPALIQRGRLDVQVVGVARSRWTLEKAQSPRRRIRSFAPCCVVSKASMGSASWSSASISGRLSSAWGRSVALRGSVGGLVARMP